MTPLVRDRMEFLRRLVGDQTEALNKLRAELHGLELQEADEKAPFKRGDIIVWGRGPFYRGRVEGMSRWFGTYRMEVTRIKKDETYGATVFLYDYEYLRASLWSAQSAVTTAKTKP